MERKRDVQRGDKDTNGSYQPESALAMKEGMYGNKRLVSCAEVLGAVSDFFSTQNY